MAPLRSPRLSLIHEERGQGDTERPRDPGDIEERGIAHPTLDVTQVLVVHAGLLGELFLCPAAVDAESANTRPEFTRLFLTCLIGSFVLHVR